MMPELRFKSFQSSEAWEQKNIGIFLEERNEQAPEDSKYPLMGFLAGKGVAPKGERYNRSFLVKNNNKKYKRTELGDFIYSSNNLESGSIGLNRYGFASISPVYSIFKTDVKSHPNFLSEFIQRPKFINKMKKYRQGVVYGQWRIHERDFLKISDYFPAYPEQEMIGSFYEKLDLKISLLTKKKEALETYKKGLMQKIFSQELRFKRDDGTDYPEWVSTKIGNHTFKVSEKNKNSESLPIYSITNKGGFVPQSEQFEGVDSSERGYDISMYKIVGKNTFAYNPARINVGSFGYSANLDRVQISSLYVCFKVKPNMSPIYLLQFMSSFKFNKSVLRNVEGGVRQYLFYDNFKNIRIPLPSLNEQEKIVQALILMDENLASLQNAIDKTQEFKKGLLQQMFV